MSGDFPTAVEARARVEGGAKLATATQIMNVRSDISRAIQEGKTTLTCWTMLPGTQNHLEGLGYTVRRFDSGHQLDGPEWTVSW